MSRPDSKGENETFSTYAIPNLLLMLGFFLFVGMMANTNQQLHQEMKASVLLEARRDSEVLMISRNDEKPSRSLSVMRSLALSRTGRMAEEYFQYPQLYGCKGLIPAMADTLRVGNLPRQVYRHLLAHPQNPKMDNLRFLEFAAHLDTVANSRVEYYLIGLLLERKLDRFAKELPRYYQVNDSLPVHYREAIVLYAHSAQHPVVTIDSPEEDANYLDFMSACSIDRNRAQKLFGHTYWWYYYN